MENQYRLEKFTEKLIPKLIPLYKDAFELKQNEHYAKGKFFSPYQRIQASHVALDKSEKIASFYGIICQKAILKGTQFYVMQSCDSMTHSNHKGKGLIAKLAQKAYEHAKEHGIELIYGFPNEAIYSLRTKKLKWRHDENINYYKFDVKTVPVAKAIKVFSGFKSLYLFFCRLVMRRYLSNLVFDNSVVADKTGGILHDQSYFDYKNSPEKFILSIEGVKFWVKIEGFLWIGDFEHTSKTKFSAALLTLKKIAKKIGCTRVAFHYQENTRNDLLLRSFTEPSGTMPVGYFEMGQNELGKKFKFCGADFDTW